jgi:hypothetical protein
MQRKTMLGLKQRAEQTVPAGTGTPGRAPATA